MTQEEPVRLVVHISPTLHKTAKATAALRGTTLRELVESAIEKELLQGKPSEEPLNKQPKNAPAKETPQEVPPANPGLEAAIAAHLEREIEKGKAEQERRVAAGIVKG